MAEGRAFLSFAEELRDEPVIILDLRGNGGGNGFMGQRWFYALLGENVPANFVRLTAEQYAGPRIVPPENTHHDRREDIEQFTHERDFYGHALIEGPKDRIVPNERLIIILADRGAASAGEGMVDLAFNMENTLVIGQNTSGAHAFNRSYPQGRTLPRSGIYFGFGRSMTLWPENHFAEGIGLAPDIWAQGDALAAALQLIINN
ncbi:MAG: hypothetical protein LBE35_07795 [Clostridiales bacterium]|nr:hypothetical protein [Clostridiales bacterium]